MNEIGPLTSAEVAMARLEGLVPSENKELRGPKLPQQRRRSKTRRDKSRARRARR